MSRFTSLILVVASASALLVLPVTGEAAEEVVPIRPRFAVLQISEPERFAVLNEGGPAAMLGLLGAGSQVAANSFNGDSLTKLALDAKTVVVPQFVSALLKSATEAKIALVYLADQPAPSETIGQKTQYDNVSTDADFILHLKIVFAGYRSASKESDYSPFALVRVLVIDRKTQERILQKVAAIGWETKSKTALVALGSTEPRYPSASALLSDPSGSLTGLSKALVIVAEAIPAKLP